MANKNTKRRQRQLAISAKQSGGFGKPVYKKKVKPFPTPNKNDKEDARVSLLHQRHVFNGQPCDCVVG